MRACIKRMKASWLRSHTCGGMAMSWRKSGCLFSQTILGINEEEVYCYQFSRTRVMYRTVVGTKGIVDKPYHGTMGKKC